MDNAFMNKINEIGEFYLTNYKTSQLQSSISLLGGRSGSILLQSVFYEATGDFRYYKEINENLDYLFTTIENDEKPMASFCSGLAGVGWLLIYLNEKKIIDLNVDDFFEDLDNFLECELSNLLENKNYDLLHGAMGVGLYFLKRKNQNQVLKILNRLLADVSKSEGDKEIKWKRFDFHLIHDHIYDFGLAHGQAGILYFLTKCYKAGVTIKSEVKQMIEGTIEFYLKNIQDIATVGSFFPSSILCSDYDTGIKTAHASRLAWCYGDLGILTTIYLAADAINDTALKNRITKMLIQVCERKSDEDTRVIDPQFCHGSAGIGYMYLNLFNKTDIVAFKETADFWAKKTLDFGSNANKDASGFVFNMGEQGFLPMVDLLSGLGGVALFLISYTNNKIESGWDSVFFLS